MTPFIIGLVGDFNSAVDAHRAIPVALQLASEMLGSEVKGKWIGTERLTTNASTELKPFAGIWCVPGSPYVSMDGALNAIRFARESGTPFLGTCGGFQHAVIEYMRTVLGHSNADHEESSPDAELPIIAKLTCSLVEKSGTVRFEPGSKLGAIYGAACADERYHCNYGLNPKFESLLAESELAIAARDEEGSVRAVELRSHPFFTATLFQPERAALQGRSHPLIEAFANAATGSSQN